MADQEPREAQADMRVVPVKAVIAGAVLAATLSGCVVTAQPASVEIPGEVVAYAPPPPVRYEVAGVAPAPGYFWIGGAWFWEGGRYAWHRVRWEAPRPGYHWVAHAWRPVDSTWHMTPGHWARG
jgi:WXXGXW repeat (2 copies)